MSFHGLIVHFFLDLINIPLTGLSMHLLKDILVGCFQDWAVWNKAAMDIYMANLNGEITVCKAVSNSITMLCGMLCTALKDRNRQCKAICVKAISYKHESAMVGGYTDDSIFGNVTLK